MTTKISQNNLDTALSASVASGVTAAEKIAAFTLERHYRKPGILTVSTGTEKWYVPAASIITGIIARVETAPTNIQGIDISVKVNAVSSATLSINTSTFVSLLNTSTININSNDIITVDVVNIGNTVPGSDLTVTFTYTRN